MSRAGGRGAASRLARSTDHGSSRLIASAWYVADHREPMRPGDPRKERDERAGACVGAVEVFHDQQDGLSLAESADHAEHTLEQPRLTALRDRGQDPATRRSRRLDANRELRDQPDQLIGRRAKDPRELIVRQLRQDGPERPHQRLVRRVGPRAERPAPEDGHRLLEAGDAADRLIDEAARADARRPVDEERP